MLDSAVTKIKSLYHLRLVSCHRMYCVIVTLLEILQIGNFPCIYLSCVKYSCLMTKIRCKNNNFSIGKKNQSVSYSL